jgi:long-chain fatty acid transport protein
LARITAEPLLLAAPDDANGDGFASYPVGRGNRTTWGGGFQLGVYYIAANDWHFGAAVKSPQWSEPFRFRTVDEIGGARGVKVNFEYPLIVTVGAAYAGWERVILACDVRYFDYANANADGFRESDFEPSGAVSGLGWSSIMAVSTGMQYRLTDCTCLRCGYSFNQNPISDALTSVNVASPVITQHYVYAGFSRQLTCR